MVTSAFVSAVTQAVAIRTGRDFVFGLVPAFDPAGTRNVTAWSASMLLAGAAALAALTARRTERATHATVWGVLAAGAALWSLASMTGVLGLLPLSDGGPSPETRESSAVAWALLRRALVWAAATLLVVASVRELARRGPTRLALESRTIDRGAVQLAAAAGLLAVASLVSAGAALAWRDAAEPWYRFLFVDFEGNLPSWYSALLLLACGAAAGMVGAVNRVRGDLTSRYWFVMAAGFVALSADEAAALHELLVTPLRSLVGGSPWLRYPLIVPGTVAVAVTAAVFGRFVWQLPGDTRRAMLGGGGVFLAGALGLETAGGWFDPELYGPNLPYLLLATAEEACEMGGVSVVLIGMLRHVERHVGPLEVGWTDGPSRARRHD